MGDIVHSGPDGASIPGGDGGPRRVQLSRAKGWRMPENTVSVARPGKWGNPFRIGGYFMMGDPAGRAAGAFGMAYCEAHSGFADHRFTLIQTAAQAVEWFRRYNERHPKDLSALAGKNLACWCRLDAPCHADVLLELANATLTPGNEDRQVGVNP